mgnify:CR=1 FL=1
MIYAKNGDALTYKGIHPDLDLALERITPAIFPGIGAGRTTGG